MKTHTYAARVQWTAANERGTTSYNAYSRDHAIAAAGKPEILASSDPAFRGDETRYNPEELFVASLSSCHMLWYLHLCALNGITVVDYRDHASGAMEEDGGSGQFVEVHLRPVVTILQTSQRTKALSLHDAAHHSCFIARSVNFPVRIEATIA